MMELPASPLVPPANPQRDQLPQRRSKHGGTSDDTENAFEIHHLRFGFDGNAFSPDLHLPALVGHRSSQPVGEPLGRMGEVPRAEFALGLQGRAVQEPAGPRGADSRQVSVGRRPVAHQRRFLQRPGVRAGRQRDLRSGEQLAPARRRHSPTGTTASTRTSRISRGARRLRLCRAG